MREQSVKINISLDNHNSFLAHPILNFCATGSFFKIRQPVARAKKKEPPSPDCCKFAVEFYSSYIYLIREGVDSYAKH